MVGHMERRIASRLQLINWSLVAGCALALCIGLAVTTFTLEGLITTEVLTAPALAVAGLWLMRRGWGERPAFTMLALAQMGCFVIFAVPLSYIGLGAGMPLQDARFAELDRLLGLDWPAYFHFAMASPELLLYAKFFYAMILVPAFGVPVVLGLTGQYIRLQQFVMAAILALCVVIVVSSCFRRSAPISSLGFPPTPRYSRRTDMEDGHATYRCYAMARCEHSSSRSSAASSPSRALTLRRRFLASGVCGASGGCVPPS